MSCVFRRLPGLLAILSLISTTAWADQRAQIEQQADAALATLRVHAPGADGLLSRAAGVLVFPDIAKIGFGTGGHYGEGVLLIDGEAKAYYASVGPEYGFGEAEGPNAQVLLFMTRQALIDFRNTANWKAGVHAGIKHVRRDVAADTERVIGPVLGFGFSKLGLLANPALRGNTINRIAR